MSSRTKRRGPSSQRAESTSSETPASSPASSDVGTNPQSPQKPSPLSRRLMWTIAIVAALWGIMLVVMVLVSANPVTLNRRQISRADAMITATVKDLDKETVTIERVWFAGKLSGLKQGETIRVKQLGTSMAKAGETYLIPIATSAPQSFAIAPSYDGDEQPPIYPANDSALEQMTAIADEREHAAESRK